MDIVPSALMPTSLMPSSLRAAETAYALSPIRNVATSRRSPST